MQSVIGDTKTALMLVGVCMSSRFQRKCNHWCIHGIKYFQSGQNGCIPTTSFVRTSMFISCKDTH